MFKLKTIRSSTLACALFFAACGGSAVLPEAVAPVSLSNVPSQMLNYRFEPDVSRPSDLATKPGPDEKNEAVQKDFDDERPQEILNRTILSPDGRRLAAVYRKISDEVSEFRLDLYDTKGKRLRKVTPEQLAVHFPDTISWSHDSANIAFVGMVRSVEGMVPAVPDPLQTTEGDGKKEESGEAAESAKPEDDPEETPEPLRVFRTEQIYTCDSNGKDLKVLTKNEGLIYFYYVWAPDSRGLAALATSMTEWRIRQARFKKAGEVFLPEGRPRFVEKGGGERLLDDFSTSVHPVWSADSTKIAAAFDKQIRIYDAVTERPTQAAIPLANDLLAASKAYEEKVLADEGPDALKVALSEKAGNENTNENSNSGTANRGTPPPGTPDLPAGDSPVSFNPIIDLHWMEGTALYFETGFVRNKSESKESTARFLRWHRLRLSPQAVDLQKAKTPKK